MPSLAEMQLTAVYELMIAKPHEPDDVKHTPEQFAIYRQGYDYALVMALRVMDAAERRYRLRVNTKRLEARRRKEQ